MNFENRYNFTENDKTVCMPLSSYCAVCDLLMVKGTTARKFDGATFYHLVCPDRPMRQYSMTRRERTDTSRYPYRLVDNR